MVDSGTQRFKKEDLAGGAGQKAQDSFTDDHIEKLADLFNEDMITPPDDDDQDTGEFMPVKDEDSGSSTPNKDQE